MASCVECDASIQHQWAYFCDTCMQASCSICWETDAQVQRTLPCGHAFHATCLAQWLQCSPTCPLCREPVDDCSEQSEQRERQRLAAAGLAIPPFLGRLRFRDQTWHLATPCSTHDLLVRCQRWLGRDDAWLTRIFAAVYHHPSRYGRFADHHGSPTYTSLQLHSLCDLVRQE